MAATGIVQRFGLRADLDLLANLPIEGELVFATDTGEHGWLDENGDVQWKKLNEAATGKIVVFTPGEEGGPD